MAALREPFFSIPNLPPLECIESMAESTVLACVDETVTASIMAWALMEMPEFAAELYRAEIGATEALWGTEIGTHLVDSPLRRRLAVYLVPWHADSGWQRCVTSPQRRGRTRASMPTRSRTLRRGGLDFRPEPLATAEPPLPAQREFVR